MSITPKTTKNAFFGVTLEIKIQKKRKEIKTKKVF